MTCFAFNKQELLARLDLAFILGLQTGDREVLQFVNLERQRHERIPRNRCRKCGVPLSGQSEHCQMHDNALRRGRPRK